MIKILSSLALLIQINLVISAQVKAVLGNNLGVGWHNSLSFEGMDDDKNIYLTAYDSRIKLGVNIYASDAKLLKIGNLKADIKPLFKFDNNNPGTPRICKIEF